MISRLKQVIALSGLSNRKFSEKLGLSQNAISEILNGRANLSSQSLVEIKRTYNINIDWLLTGEGEMFIQSQAKGVTQGDDSINISGGNTGNITVNKNNYYLNDEEIKLMEEIRKSSKEKVINTIIKALKGTIIILAIYAVYEAVREMPGLEGKETSRPFAEMKDGKGKL